VRGFGTGADLDVGDFRAAVTAADDTDFDFDGAADAVVDEGADPASLKRLPQAHFAI
jgi:hypothetical protein